MKKFTSAYDAFWFLQEHSEFHNPELMALYPKDPSMWCGFSKCVDWSYQKINPKTERIDCFEHKNTKIQVWIECGGYMKHGASYYPSHDIKLDCGGDTFDEALIALAHAVYKEYGEGRKYR